MFRWYRELSTADRRAFWGAYGGWGLDAMDVQIFSFLIPSLIATLRITRGEIGVLGTSVLISSAIGGWLGGILGDRFGRVRTMQITVIWYSLFTFLCGFATNFDQMLAFRVMQGIGFGGEWAAGAVLIGEIVKPQHRGKTSGCIWERLRDRLRGAAALLTSLVLALAPPDIAWRWAFWLGLLPAVLVIFIRRFVTEPEIFEEAKAAQVSGHKVGSMEIFRSTAQAYTACLLAIHRASRQRRNDPDLASHLFEDRTRPFQFGVRHLHRRRNRGRFFWLHRERLPERHVEQALLFYYLLRSQLCLHHSLRISAHVRRYDAVAGFPARLRCTRQLRFAGAIPDRTIPHRTSGDRARFFEFHRASDRWTVRSDCRLSEYSLHLD